MLQKVKRITKYALHFLPILIIVGTIAWACGSILLRTSEQGSNDEIVIRIAHWQLEAGVRDAFVEMAAEYRKLHPNVRIEQTAIPESGYAQWVSTQLLGGTAPDIIEIGIGLPWNMWVSYMKRYFIPLGEYLEIPNPYNKGTDLENMPTRLTAFNGMRDGYVEELQEYMAVPLSQFGSRVFYNKTLLKELTGSDQPPHTYSEFAAVCEKIKKCTDENGKAYIPIASSKYHIGGWELYLVESVTQSLINKIDYNKDYGISNDELYVAIKTGQLSFNSPVLRARFDLLRNLTQYFQTGWVGVNRDEAVFLFAQQKAVFILSGSWDMMSFVEQAKGKFEIGVMNFPLPDKNDPKYGKFILAPLYQYPYIGFLFGVTRFSKHPDVAIDFLMFLASRKMNQKINRTIGWIPSIQGAEVQPGLEAFKPNVYGMYIGFNTIKMNLGGETWIKWAQAYSLFQIGKISYDQFIREFEPFYKSHGMNDFLEQQRDWRRAAVTQEQFITSLRAAAMNADKEKSSKWQRYSVLVTDRQFTQDIDHNTQLMMVTGKRLPPQVGPYEYRKEALEQVRQNLLRTDVK